MRQVSVLIIEDDKWLAEQHARVLSGAGFKTTVAFHAISAIRTIDKNLPDVIVLDVLLTGSTAFALLHELQSYGDTGNVPVIICTSIATDLSLSRLGDYGVRKILDKTIMTPQDLVFAIKEVM